MKRMASIVVIVAGMAGAARGAAAACTELAFRERVELPAGRLTLADLLLPGTCAEWGQRAEQVGLGAVPRPGMVRTLSATQVRLLAENLADIRAVALPALRVPDRIEIGSIKINSAGGAKSCADIARFIEHWTNPATSAPSGAFEKTLECGAAPRMASSATLELVRTAWMAQRKRRQYTLRCARAEDCVPFVVWGRDEIAGQEAQPIVPPSLTGRLPTSRKSETLVKAGEPALLVWEQRGIRVVAPVICLEGGESGQFVRVRLKNADRTLRAEVVGPGSVRIGS
jgi:hypothetical protein